MYFVLPLWQSCWWIPKHTCLQMWSFSSPGKNAWFIGTQSRKEAQCGNSRVWNTERKNWANCPSGCYHAAAQSHCLAKCICSMSQGPFVFIYFPSPTASCLKLRKRSPPQDLTVQGASRRSNVRCQYKCLPPNPAQEVRALWALVEKEDDLCDKTNKTTMVRQLAS